MREPPVWLEAPTPDASVVHEMAALTPVSDRLSWFTFAWRPDWCRWAVYQMVPPHAAPSYMWGPETKTIYRPEVLLGRRMLRATTDERFRLVLNRQNMTRWAWDLHVATGCYPQPIWVVQGNHGGHKWNFTPQEQKLLGMQGLPEDPPTPGSLPYAPIDRRVINALLPMATGRVELWNMLSRGLHELDERDLDTEEKDAMVAGNWALWSWIQTQVDQTVETSGVRVAGDPGAGYRDADAGYEEQLETFINSDSN